MPTGPHVDRFAHALRRLGTLYTRLAGRAGTGGDLTKPELMALGVLGVHGPSRMGEVAAHLAVGQSAVTPVIDRLEGRGLVARRRSDTDRRVWLVTLTPAGEAAFAEDTELYRRVAAAMLEPLDAEEQAELLRLLAKVDAAVPVGGTTPAEQG